MGYIKSSLMQGESILYEGRLSLWALGKWFALGFAMVPFLFIDANWSAFVFLLGVGMIMAGLIQFATTEMAVTSQRVIEKRGWIARRTTEISLARVEGVEVNQTMVQRLLDYGHILVSGVGSHKARIRFVASPLAFRRAFLDALGEFDAAGKTGPSARAEGVADECGEGGSPPRRPWARATEYPPVRGCSHDRAGFVEDLRAVACRDDELGWIIPDPAALAGLAARWSDQPDLFRGLVLLNADHPVTLRLERPEGAAGPVGALAG